MEPRATDSPKSSPPTPDSFGNWLRRRRKALDLTQEQLAQRVGCARVTVKRIEADELVPSKQLASLLAEQVGIPAGEREAFIRFARSGHPVESVAQVFESATPTPWQVHPQPFNQLPLYLTSFVGRDKEIAEASKLLASHRLVTFIGPGGIGKTRLAVQVAANEQKASGFPDGVWLVELAALTDASSVPRAVATALGLHEEAGVAIANGLTHFIGEKKSLLALDNCEHLIKACAELAEILLRANPNLCILATSREALGVAGEKVLHLTGLALPRDETSLLALSRSGATQLFLERAQSVLPSFEFTKENTAWVLGVCRRLDGIPLAIELAAARVKLLTVEQIAARLDDRFNLLTMGSRTALPRQQTLRATIDWS
ncbi:MAG TPA: helix-turn-helix domain-containing protein, partial [Anaerolineae bacterium]